MGCFPPNGSYSIKVLNNAHFHLEKGHPLGREMLVEVGKVFDPKSKRNHIGPPLMHRTTCEVLNMKRLVNFNGKVTIKFMRFCKLGPHLSMKYILCDSDEITEKN